MLGDIQRDLRDLALAVTRPVAQGTTIRIGTVVSSGAAGVTVTVAGADITFPRLASYTPTTGHRVLILMFGETGVVLGRILP